MAYQARGRDPLLDSNMAGVIERRGKELLGLGLLVLGGLAAAMVLTYHPADPSWLSATDAPVRNWTGRVGAGIAAPVFMILGWGSLGLAIVPAAWGVRLLLHAGDDRALRRAVFAPLWLVALALYASSLAPGDDWSAAHSFGLGGLFGDMVLGTLLGLLPISASFGLKLLSLGLGALLVVLGGFVLGFTRDEAARILRFLVLGLVGSYAAVVALLGRGAAGAAGAARQVQTRRQAVRASADEPDDGTPAEPPLSMRPRAPEAAEPAEAPETGGGLLARMPSLIRRPEPMPEPELVQPESPAEVDDMPGDDRIRAKISQAVKSRVRQGVGGQAPLTRGLGRGPDKLVLDTASTEDGLPPEPPLTSGDGARPGQAAAAQGAAPGHASPDVARAAGNREDAAPATPDTAGQAEAAPRIPTAEPRKVVQHTPRKTPQPSARAQAEAQPALQFGDAPEAEFELPPLSLLTNPETIERHHLSDAALEENARMLESVLDDYGVKGEIVSVRPGPVVTMYELEPAPGLKASRVIGLADDIARSMSALSARVSTVPGRSVIGIELPNDSREMVVLREILASRDFGDGNQRLPLALGKDIGGDPIVANLAKMPHLLIAGTTGSGKSVAINTMILSLLYKLSPEECRLIMIDPKMLELSVYDGIPHLLSPVVTDPKKAVVALKWVVAEMEERYRKMSKMGVRNIDGYNSRVAEALSKGEMFSRTVQTGFDEETGEPVFETEEFAPEKMPYIVVIVDEMADLMMVAGKEIEACIQRLAQMARASGIHLIMATQRPSVDVITGTIKANFPTRISFQVTSKVDSRTILGEMGAEQLLGMGDMLYMAGGARITRCHGPFVSDEEVEEVVNNLKAYGPPDYVSGVVDGPAEEKSSEIDQVLGLSTGGNTDGEDALYDQAVQIAIKDRKCSTSYIQRKLAIGYNKAARLVEQMEEQGVVSPANHVGKREVLVPEPQ
ncbi:DNA translocase FtsK [Roseovarius salinarum]|uniref:DNA translocase FtsK n=1 Tax=Roseovarius salinarum TaxID=1981892 RepID=UPI000C324F1E|nr:DNA translocase FtsK [Roseovarius salinarum]